MPNLSENSNYNPNLVWILQDSENIHLSVQFTIRPKKSVSLRYFDTCYRHNIGGVPDRR